MSDYRQPARDARFDLSSLDPRSSHLHFVGVGGVSMQALAQWCSNEGFTVSGCDSGTPAAAVALRAAGVDLHQGHHAEHVSAADVVIHSMAVPHDHPELVAARDGEKVVVKRIELLGELFRLRRAIGVTGTHGKSTTTGMLATMMLALDPETSVLLGASLAALCGY